MMSRLGVSFMGVLARVPLPVLRAMGAALGRVLLLLVGATAQDCSAQS